MKKIYIETLFLIGLGVFYLILSLDFSMGSIAYPEPGFFPRVIAILTIICSALHLLLSIRARNQNVNINVIWEGVSLENIPSTASILAIVILYLLILNFVGFLAASLPFMLFLARLMGGKNWISNAVLAIVSSIGTYWLFWIMMRVPIPLGVVWGN
jgi:hypothetical protein